MAKTSKKVADKEATEEKLEVTESASETNEVAEVEQEETEKTFKVKFYLEGHKQPYVKEFASQGELERAYEALKKNKSVISFK